MHVKTIFSYSHKDAVYQFLASNSQFQLLRFSKNFFMMAVTLTTGVHRNSVATLFRYEQVFHRTTDTYGHYFDATLFRCSDELEANRHYFDTTLFRCTPVEHFDCSVLVSSPQNYGLVTIVCLRNGPKNRCKHPIATN